MLEKALPYKVLSTLEKVPRGLDSTYARMISQIQDSEDSDDFMICKSILILAVLAYQLLHLRESGAIADLAKKLWEDLPSLEGLVPRCGSFLTVQKGRVSHVHQSAKDYFTTGKGSSIILSSYQEEHGKIAYRSLDLMSNVLREREDTCDLQKPGTFVAEAYKRFSQSRFTHVEYACCHWVDHLTGSSRNWHNQLSPLNNGEIVNVFLRNHLLHWLEVLSLLGKVSEGVLMFKHLQLITN